jgi:hypothetical protein
VVLIALAIIESSLFVLQSGSPVSDDPSVAGIFTSESPSIYSEGYFYTAMRHGLRQRESSYKLTGRNLRDEDFKVDDEGRYVHRGLPHAPQFPDRLEQRALRCGSAIVGIAR